MAQEALGLLECKGLVALMEGADAMMKAANVEMIGWDKAGSGMVTAFVKAAAAGVKAAIAAAAKAAGRIGQVISVHVIARPHDDLGGMMPKKKGAAPAMAGAKKQFVARGSRPRFQALKPRARRPCYGEHTWQRQTEAMDRTGMHWAWWRPRDGLGSSRRRTRCP